MATVLSMLSGPAYVVKARPSKPTSRASVAAMGISIGMASSYVGEGSMPRHYQYGARIETTIGYPNPPSLALDYIGFWRFRWLVGPGVRTISVWLKQASNGTPRPSVILKANASVGLVADVETVAGSSADWIQIGPVSFTATAKGIIWVELHNRIMTEIDTCYFGKVSTE